MSYKPIPGTRIFAFGGASRSGKDTAARIIYEIHPAQSAYFAFSDAISVYCRILQGMTKRDPKLLQTAGFALRQTNPAVWTDALYWLLDERRPRTALITGVRFPDELAMLRAAGAKLVWVERVRPDGSTVTATDRDPNVPTETALTRTDFDYLLTNPDGEELKYRMRVLALYDSLTRR